VIRKKYNQYTGLKYTKTEILNICNTIPNRKIFCKKGFRTIAIKLGILDECNNILDNNKKNIELKNIQFILNDIDNKISNYISISSFLNDNPKYKYIIRNKEPFKQKYSNYFIKQKFSTQQLICKKILESILKQTCEYNTRKILKTKELDIFFKSYNIAFEYDGYYWHKNRINEDFLKEKLCKHNTIILFRITEPSLNEYSTLNKSIDGIKQQIKILIPKINNITRMNITENDVDSVSITQNDLLYNCYLKKDLDYILNECCRYSEIKTKYNKIWQFILRNKLLHILNPVKKRDYIYMSSDEFIDWVLRNFKTYTDFIKHKSYQLALKRKIIYKIKQKFYNRHKDV